VIQVVQSIKTDSYSNASGAWADVTGLSVNITPVSASSKILVLTTIHTSVPHGYTTFVRVLRNGTPIGVGDASGSRTRATSTFYSYSGSTTYSFNVPLHSEIYDSPATSSSITYKVQAYGHGSTVAVNNQLIGNDDASYSAVVSSSITVMEISA
jgi:hypothetical protein